MFIRVRLDDRNAKSVLGAAQKVNRDQVRALGASRARRENNSDVDYVAEMAVKIYEVQGSVDFSRERQDRKRDRVPETTVDGCALGGKMNRRCKHPALQDRKGGCP